jgi:uncharacterized protein YegL
MSFLTRHLLSLFAIAFAFATSSFASDSVVIVLDDSGSMNEKMSGGIKRIEAAKNAIKIVLRQFSPDTKVGLLLLNGDRAKQHWAIPLEHLSVPQATRRVESVVADGSTPLGERMREAADALMKQREQEIYGTYRLLIVTDGEANDAKLLAQYLPDVLSRGLVVDAIGVDMKQNHSLATRVHSYRRADDAVALSKAVQEVFAEKTVSGVSDAQEDYSLLQAFDDETAKQALLALSKPNNSPIVGFAIPSESSTPVAMPSTVPIGGSSAAQSNSASSILRTAVATFLNCMLGLVIFVIVVVAVFSKSKLIRRPRR